MTKLVACLTTGKGSWANVSNLMKAQEWEKIYLVTNTFGKEKFTSNIPFEFVLIDDNAPINVIRDLIINSLNGKVSIEEVALNINSGTGKEHMAIIGALLKLGSGIRLMNSEDGKLIEV